jgi:hypothetical protein
MIAINMINKFGLDIIIPGWFSEVLMHPLRESRASLTHLTLS